MRLPLRRIGFMLASLVALAPVSSAYYYYVLFPNSGGPYVQMPARFDLNAADPHGLQNNTVNYLIAAQGPAVLTPGDSFQAVVSQIRAAADVWNSVNTSAIRLAFGGLSSMSTPDSSPEIDVVFSDEIPPGLIAQTVHTTVQNVSPLIATGATFVPILRSEIQLRSDLTNPFQQPSYSDSFFLTVAHEFGHALGLQHTKTSSLMSTSITRATTKAAPLAADDIAGISLLYPANGFAAATGSISGTVTMKGAGVNLATVVALSPAGNAISTLTNPDGSYTIGGVGPGQYFVYVQPLPPAQPGEAYPDNVTPPADASQNPYPANTGFAAQFYGGTNDWTQSPAVSVTAGNAASGINFTVQPSSGPSIYDMVLYAFIGNPAVPVQGPPLQSGTSATIEFYAQSNTNSDGYLHFSKGLNLSVIGGAAQIVPNSLAPASQAPYLYAFVFLGNVSSATPAALAVTLNGDLYVLPSAFSVVPSAPPAISSVNGNTDSQGNAVVTVAGSNLGSNTRILFDGAAGTVLGTNTDGSLNVAAPPASSGYRASVEALSADNQTSGQTLGSSAPPSFLYSGPAFPAIGVSSPATPALAGTDTMVSVNGYNTDFAGGQTTVGFGSSDVVVKRVWVVSPGRLMLNVSISPTAQSQSTTVSVATGLQLATLSTAFQIAPAGPGQISLRTPIVNQATQLGGVPVGGTAVINTSGLPSNLSGWTLTIGGQPASFTVSGSQILATVPGGLLIGPQVVQLIAPNGPAIPPVIMQVDQAAPMITAASTLASALIDSSHAAHPGQVVLLTVNGLADEYGILPPISAVDVNVGGLDEVPAAMVPAGVNGAQLQVLLPGTLPIGNTQVTIRVDSRLSAPFTIALQ